MATMELDNVAELQLALDQLMAIRNELRHGPVYDRLVDGYLSSAIIRIAKVKRQAQENSCH